MTYDEYIEREAHARWVDCGSWLPKGVDGRSNRVVWVSLGDGFVAGSPFALRRWWPIWDNLHIDPQLGRVGALPHFHLAVDRVSEGTVRACQAAGHVYADGAGNCARRALHGWVVRPWWISGVGQRSTRPCAPPSSPARAFDPPDRFERMLGIEGPVVAKDGRCPHRGCPVESMKPVAGGCRICPWHGLRVIVEPLGAGRLPSSPRPAPD